MRSYVKMRPYPREYLWFVERVLRSRPEKLRELRNLELTIEACCRGPGFPAPDGRSEGRDSTEPERVTDAKLKNKRYQELSRQVEKITHALALLTGREREVADLFFTGELKSREVAEELRLDERHVRRMKTRILKKASKVIIPMWANL